MWGAAVGLADLTPPGIRYGYVHPATRRLLQRPLNALTPVEGAAFAAPKHVQSAGPTDLRCGLVADHLDVGGIGRVVEMLTEGFRGAGVEPVVIVPAVGARVGRLHDLGFEVVIAHARSARAALRDAALDVLQVHSAPAPLLAAALDTGAPVVPVLHNTEIHYQRPQWRSITQLFERADAVIAVSELVRSFHRARLPAAVGDKIVVVPNGALPMLAATPEVRARARAQLSRVLGIDLDGEVVFACLARYDSQKNLAGTVVAFLAAADRSEVPVRLVAAGDPSDWLEVKRADALRRAHRHGDRVHLLGNSDAATLLVASDAFVLDSFFEGWPLATTEAVAAGLPVVVSETGGAAELVARAPHGSRLVGNPTGPAAAVTDVRARAARRRAPHQINREALATAIAGLAHEVAGGPAGQSAADHSYDEMVTGHARVVREVRDARARDSR
ncbi:MAG: glycosyltransferase family 4 protein [Candidatus Nanopelagicales bacterium]